MRTQIEREDGFYGQLGGICTPAETPFTLLHEAVETSPCPLYSNLILSSLTFWHGKASLHKRFTATFEEEVPLMFLKLILLISTREGPCNKSKRGESVFQCISMY
ncbi:hypothetical protein AMTRI_Chr12g273570 [Amborella trichopoda]